MKFRTIGSIIIASAIIWGAVIVGCSLKLRGTDCYDEISTILFGGVLTHILLLGGFSAALVKKMKDEEAGEE